MRRASWLHVLKDAVRASLLVGASAPAFSACGGRPEAPDDTCTLSSTIPYAEIDDGCVQYFSLSSTGCGGDGGAVAPSTCAILCPPQGSTAATSCSVAPYPDGPELVCGYFVCGSVGRRPPGWRDRARRNGERGALAHLRRVAHLEAASVTAFAVLERELAFHCAPDALRRRARRAAIDEVRHARVVGALAGARLSSDPTYRVHASALLSARARRPRALEAIARDNAVEGCVHETFGAAIALLQAAQARDGAVRSAMAGVARDEARHAALAWAIDRWLEDRLEPGARRRARRARCRAVAALEASIASMAEEPFRGALGLPTRAQARVLFDALRAGAWG